MAVVCLECGFEAKTSQGLASHRLIKHNVVPKIAEKQAELSAKAVSQVVDEFYTRLDEQAEATEERIVELSSKIENHKAEVLDVFNQVVELLNQALGKGLPDSLSRHYDQFAEGLRDSLSRHYDQFAEVVSKLAVVVRDVQLRVEHIEEGNKNSQSKVKEVHPPLRYLWDNANGFCAECEADKQAIIAELRRESEAKVGTTAEVPKLVPTPAPEARDEDSPEAAEPKRWKVVKEPFVTAFVDKEYQSLPSDIPEPKVGTLTDDEVLAEKWRRAGYQLELVEDLGSEQAPTTASKARRKPGWESRGVVDRIKEGEDLF